MYSSYCVYLSVLKVDVQAGLNFVVMTALMNFIGFVELAVDVVGLFFTLLWAFAAWGAVSSLKSGGCYFEEGRLLIKV